MSVDDSRTKRIPPTLVQDVAKALSSDLRLRILEVLGDRTLSVSQLMEELGAAQPTISINVQLLEQAGLITSSQGQNREKLCSRAVDRLLLELPRNPGEGLETLESVSMPVGLYTDCSVEPTCGLAGKEGLIGAPDDPHTFYLPDRAHAQLLWFSSAGHVEYRFPNPVPPGVELRALEISAELCAEALGFNEDWPSDITLFVNGVRIGAVTSLGDFGTEKGRFTPAWWVYSSQYGELHKWRIEAGGSKLNGSPLSEVALAALGLQFNRPITVRFEVEADAKNRRGMNLFGASFGNFPQDIVLTFVRI